MATTSIVLLLILLFYRKNKKRMINDISASLQRNGRWSKRPLLGVTDITLHHTAGYRTISEYNSQHINENGWASISYHYIIDVNGDIYKLNNDNDLTYHNGTNNVNAIGVGLIGDFTYTSPTAEQMESLIFLITKKKKDIPTIKYLMGHKEYRNHTACPASLDVSSLRKHSNLLKNPSYS